MFQRTIKSALFIDFDNIVGVFGKDLVETIPHWMAWLEDGRFDADSGRREFRQRRVYWNSPGEKFRAAFEKHGFEAFVCPARVKNKSAADMIIALDAIQCTYDERAIKEFVLLTTDTDFVSLLDRLGEREKRTVATGDENNKLIFTIFSDHADHVITSASFKTAMRYERPARRGLAFSWGGVPRPARPPASPAQVPKAAPVAKEPAQAPWPRPATPPATPSPPPQPETDLQAAARHVVEMAKAMDGLRVGRQTVCRGLKHRMGRKFATSGKGSFLGCGSYKALIEHLVAERRSELELVKEHNGGIVIRFRSGE
jgi:hypothetical protein